MSTLLLPLIFTAGVCSGQGPVASAWPERLQSDPGTLVAEAVSQAGPAIAPGRELPQSAAEVHRGY